MLGGARGRCNETLIRQMCDCGCCNVVLFPWHSSFAAPPVDSVSGSASRQSLARARSSASWVTATATSRRFVPFCAAKGTDSVRLLESEDGPRSFRTNICNGKQSTNPFLCRDEGLFGCSCGQRPQLERLQLCLACLKNFASQ